MCLRPATPGFLITLAATVCLVVVSFSVPYFKTVYFLEASLAVDNVTGNVTFGTLGYCLQLPGNTTCSSPQVGYQFNADELNQLLGLDGAIQIPELFVSWLTYPLVLHIVGLALSALATLFGLLAHVREMAMTCLSTFVSGFAATIVLLAFIFDLVIFFVARSRLNSVPNGSASIGNAVWLTLAAWLLLFFAGCAFGIGRCCLARRPRVPKSSVPQRDNSFSNAIRLDAIKAEADRQARQHTEVGLPAFQEYESRPLTAKEEPKYLDEEDEEEDGVLYRDHSPLPLETPSSPPGQTTVPGSYYTSPSRSENQPPVPLNEPPFYQNVAAPSAPTYEGPSQDQLNSGYGQHSYVPRPSPAYGSASQFPPWQSGNSYYTDDLDQGTSTGPHHDIPPVQQYQTPAADPYVPTSGSYESSAVHPNIYMSSTSGPYAAPAVHGSYLGSDNLVNEGDYIDPYARPLQAIQPEATYHTPQPHEGDASASNGSSLEASRDGFGVEYRSPYLPQPGGQYSRGAQMGTGHTSPNSPTGPRGPRPPSAGYYR